MFWGYHSFLYPNLGPEQTVELEAAIRLVFHGKFDEARKVFEGPVLQACDHPLVSVEFSGLYERMGLPHERLLVLSRCKKPFGHTQPTEGADIWDLVELLQCVADFFANGKLRPALVFAARLSLRLSRKHVSQYTVVEVSVLHLDSILN